MFLLSQHNWEKSNHFNIFRIGTAASVWVKSRFQLIGGEIYSEQIVKQIKSPMDNCSNRQNSKNW